MELTAAVVPGSLTTTETSWVDSAVSFAAAGFLAVGFVIGGAGSPYLLLAQAGQLDGVGLPMLGAGLSVTLPLRRRNDPRYSPFSGITDIDSFFGPVCTVSNSGDFLIPYATDDRSAHDGTRISTWGVIPVRCVGVNVSAALPVALHSQVESDSLPQPVPVQMARLIDGYVLAGNTWSRAYAGLSLLLDRNGVDHSAPGGAPLIAGELQLVSLGNGTVVGTAWGVTWFYSGYVVGGYGFVTGSGGEALGLPDYTGLTRVVGEGSHAVLFTSTGTVVLLGTGSRTVSSHGAPGPAVPSMLAHGDLLRPWGFQRVAALGGSYVLPPAGVGALATLLVAPGGVPASEPTPIAGTTAPAVGGTGNYQLVYTVVASQFVVVFVDGNSQLYVIKIAPDTVPPALRLAQRNDGFGANPAPRLRAGTGASTSVQTSVAPRVGSKNRYL